MESIRLSWLQQTSAASLHHDNRQSIKIRPALLHNQRFYSYPIFCLSSNTEQDTRTRIKRYTRAIKRDAELRKDLQLFLSSQGFPPDKVPTTKELSDSGREDLAKSVRRRGYKAIQALLAESDAEPSTAHIINTDHSIEDSGRGDSVRDPEPSTAHVSNTACIAQDSIMNAPETILFTQFSSGEELPTESGTCADTGQEVESNPSKHSSGEQLLTESGTCADTGQEVESNPSKHSSGLQEGIQPGTSLKNTMFSNGSLIEEDTEEKMRMKAAEFVRTGRLSTVSDSEEEEEDDNDEFLEDSSDEEENTELQNGQASAEEKAARLRAKLLPFMRSNSTGLPYNQVVESFFDNLQRPTESESNQARSGFGADAPEETDVELQKMKMALMNKEKELIELTRDLEETKAQLTLVQAKATAEVAQAKQLVLEKDIRLKSADLALASLKQVQVEYWGEGRRVELAGSFNGWKHFISLEPDPTSEIVKPDGSRGPMMWEVELWLYPGVYEIKFIVDENWLIDQRREIVMRNSLHNNLLRVEP